MSMDSEILTLQVDINDDPMNQKVDAIEERLTGLQKTSKEMAETAMPTTESLPGYNDAFMRKLSDWQKSLTDIGRARSSMEHAMSSYEREDLSAVFKRKVEVANASIKDLINSQNLVQELLGALGPEMSKVFSEGLTGLVTQLSTGIRTTASAISSEVSRKLTDDEIVDRYMRSDDEYGKIIQKLHQSNPNHTDVFSQSNMRKYLMANVPMSVPQYMREAVTGGSQVQFRKGPESYVEMLPRTFQKIEPHPEKSFREDGTLRALGENPHAEETLTADEISALGRIVRNNRFAADAAVKAGIIAKSGKKMYFNHDTNHDMMDAMAGYIMDDMTKAAQGESKFGIKNVEDPKKWKKIQNKIGNNKTLDGTLEAARAMDTSFPWLNPGRFGTGFEPFNPETGNAEYIGRITHSPRKTSRAFAEYSLDMMQQGVQLNGKHPFLLNEKTGRWEELPRVTGPRAASKYGPAVTPDDFHTISMNNSLLQKLVMDSPHASRVGLNGFSDNMFYLKFDEALGDPGLTKERRAELAKQYGDLFASGYNANGEHYISTRVSKTHAEFMKDSIVDDIGRKALGMPYAKKGETLDEDTAARVRRAGLEVLANGGLPSGHDGTYKTFKDFAKTLYNENNMATEAESLSTWLGTKFGFTGNEETEKRLAEKGLTQEQQNRIMEQYGTPNMKVVVGSFGSADMDGSNWISDRISDQGFQGRTFGGKATYVPINMRDFRFKNYKQIERTTESDAKIAELTQEKEARLAPLNEKIAEANKRKEERIAELDTRHNADLSKIDDERTARLSELNTWRDESLSKIENDRTARLERINKGESNKAWHDAEEAKLEKWYATEKSKIEDHYSTEARRAEDSYASEKSKIEEKYSTEKTKTEDKYKKSTEPYESKIAKTEDIYRRKEASIMNQYGGDLIIPGAGLGGSDLRVSKDTDVVEDINNIKHFKTALKPEFDAKIKEIKESNLSDSEKEAQIQAATEDFQKRINETRSRDYSRDEIWAKTTYDDANTSSRWLSKQLINSSMNAGFRDPRVQRFFDKQFFDELARMDDDQYVRDLLFKGDQNVDLQSEAAQKTINDHVAGMWSRYNEGDRLLPQGVFKYAMAAPNPQNVINNRLKEAGIALTPEQEALQLQDNQVISMESLNKQLGVVRFPATKSGNVTVDNVSAEELIARGGASREQIQNLAKSSGIVDTKGLYFAPNSPILQLLQGEDFDGDLNGYFGLSDNLKPEVAKEFSEVMRIIANASDAEVAQINKDAYGEGKTQEEINERQNARKSKQTYRSTKDKPEGYNILDPYDKADYLVNVPREHYMMGAAERSADMAALYYAGLNDPRQRGYLAQAIRDYESQYDVVSTNMKTDEAWKKTEAQAYAANLGLSFSRMFKYANEAIETSGENDDSERVWTGRSKQALEEKGIDQLGLPSLFQGEVMGTLMGRMKARQNDIDPENGVFDWQSVLLDPKQGLAMPEGVKANSEQGKFVQMMREVRSDLLSSKYLVASNETVAALQGQYEKAVKEIEDGLDPNSPNALKIKQERLTAIGARAFDNFKQYGSTESNVPFATWTQKALEDFSQQTGIPVSQLTGHASFVQGQQLAQDQIKEASDKMLSQETPRAEAERLLRESGLATRQINSLLNANERDTLISAITGNDMKKLKSITGVGEKTATIAMSALQGAKILGVQPTPIEETYKPVASVVAPEPEIQEPKPIPEPANQTVQEPERKVPEETNKPEEKPAVSKQPETQQPVVSKEPEPQQPEEVITRENLAKQYRKIQQYYEVGFDETGNVEELLRREKSYFDQANKEEDRQRSMTAVGEIEKYLNMEAAFDKQAKQRGETLSTRPINEILGDLNSAKTEDDYNKFLDELILARTERSGIRQSLDGYRPIDEIMNDIRAAGSETEYKKFSKELKETKDAEAEAMKDRPEDNVQRINRPKNQSTSKPPVPTNNQPPVPPVPPNNQPPVPPNNPPPAPSNNPPSTPPGGQPPTPPNGQPPVPPNNPPPNWPSAPQVTPTAFDQASMQSYSNQIIGEAKEFSRRLYGEALNYQEKEKGTPKSIIDANKNDAIAARYEQQIKDILAVPGYNIPDEQRRDMETLISPQNGLVAKAGKDFSALSMYNSSQVLEGIKGAEDKATGAYDAQVEALEKWDQKIKEVEEDQKRLLAMSNDSKYAQNLRDQFKQSADKLGEDLTQINASRLGLQNGMQEKNQEAFNKQIEGLENKLHPGNKVEQQSRAYREQISNIRTSLTQKHDAGLISDAAFQSDIDRLDALEKKTSKTALSMKQAFSTVGQSITKSITNLANRYGRQLFYKALNEAKKFVQEFDKSMTSIRMITLKTDSQMSALGDGLIAKAKELKISISEITQSAESLYRQGLSDQEVNDRLDVISKFSKVSGTKVDAATKLITIAMNTGLVSDPQVAADVVTALGDNAATNASEIEKGIEKSGAAAAADGTTFGQLAAMLTAITSTTQIGGNVAGRTLNTIFGRMNKIGTNELIYDENGHAISGSAVAKLLESQGIRQYDEEGNKRSSYDVLSDLSRKWEKMSDAEQQQIANAIAGTRQYSNFAAIMQGMNEGKVDEYMDTLMNSEGIVDKKYEIYVKSLQASLTDLKNTFDDLIHDLTDSGALSGFLDGITGMIKGVDNLTNSVGGLEAALATVLPMLIGLTLLKTGMATANMGLFVGGLAAVAAGGIVAGIAGSATQAETDRERYQRVATANNQSHANYVSDIERAKELKNLGSNRSEAENIEYKTLLTSLAQIANIDFSDLSSGVGDAASRVDDLSKSASNLGTAAKEAIPHIENYADYIINGAEKDADNKKALGFYAGISEIAVGTSEAAREASGEYDNGVGIHRITPLFYFDDETGKFQIKGNAHQNISSDDYFSGMKSLIRSAPSPAMPKIKSSVGTVFSEALKAPNLSYNIPDDYKGHDAQYWINYFSGGLLGYGTPQDLPDSVLNAVVDYWNMSNRIKTKESVVKDAVVNKISEYLKNEEFSFIPDEYKTSLASLIYQEMPTSYGQKQFDPTTIKYALYNAAGISDETDLSTLKTEDINTNIGKYIKSKLGLPAIAGKVTYHEKPYDSQKLAEEQRAVDFDAYKTKNEIKELSLVGYGERKWQVGEEDEELAEQMAQDRQKDIDDNINALVEGSYRTGHIVNGKLLSDLELSNLFDEYAAEEQHKLEEDKYLYAYKDAAGKTTVSMNKEEVEKARMADYNAAALFSAVQSGDYSRLYKEYGANALPRVVEWYQSQSDNNSYDNFINTHAIASKKGYSYNGQFYDIKSDAHAAQLKDFDEMINEQQGYYEIDGVRYTSKADAIANGRDYLERQWNENHKIGEAENVFVYNGEEYTSREDAENQRKSDFYDASENAIEAAVEEEHQDALKAGVKTGLTAWEQDNKNAYALRADKLRRDLEAEGVNDITSLENYLNAKGTVDWEYLTENNGEFARLVDSIQRDNEGNIINPEIYDKIMSSLRSNGRDFGSSVKSSSQKAIITQDMFKHLTGEETGYLSIEEARDAAQREYEKQQADYEDYIQQLTNERVSVVTGYVSDEARKQYESDIRANNPYEEWAKSRGLSGLNADQMAASYRVYSDKEKEYLKEIVGEQIYDRLIKHEASDEEIAYANTVLENRAYGMTGLTTAQRLEGINRLRTEYSDYGVIESNPEIAKQYLSGWANADEYLALAGREGLNDEEISRLEVLENALDVFQKETQIKFEIEGVQALENAGKVAEGTTAKIEKLRKGGKIRVQVEMQIHNEAYESGQKRSKLYNGNEIEQDETAMSLLGMSREEYYGYQGQDRNKNLAKAQTLDTDTFQGIDATSWMKLYEAEKTPEGKQIILDAAKIAGFNPISKEDGSVHNFVYTGSEQANTGSLVGAHKNYSESEKTSMLNRILNGEERTVGMGGNSDLYDAAVESAGEYTREYVRLIERGKAPSNRLRSLASYEVSQAQSTQNQGYRNSAVEYEKAALASKDLNNEQNRNTLASYLGVDESRVLELSRQSTNNGESNALLDMLTDKREGLVRTIAQNLESQFDDINKESETLNELELGDVTDFDSLVANLRAAAESADAATAKKLNELADSFEQAKAAAETDLSEAFTQAQDKLKENTYEYLGISFLREASKSYNPETNDNFIDYAKGFTTESGQTWDNNWNTATTGNNGIVAASMLMQNGTITSEQFQKFATDQLNGAGKNFDYYDLLMQAGLGNNYQNGEVQQNGLRETLEAMKGDASLKGVYDELIQKYPQLEDVADGSMTAVKRLNEQLKTDKSSDVTKYAKGIDGLADALTDLGKGGTNADKGIQKIKAGMVDLVDKQTALNKASGLSGKQLESMKKKGDQTLDLLASMTPYDSDQLVKMSAEKIQELINEAQPQVNDLFADTIESMFSSIPSINAEVDLSKIVSVGADGSIDLSDVNNVLTDAEEEVLRRILALAGEYANINISSILNGDSISVSSFVELLRKAGVKTGGSYSRKSGKTGGGKSATDKAIQKAGYNVKPSEHDVKMAQMEQEHHEFVKDYQGQIDAIYKEAKAQKELVKAYEQNIEDLKAQQGHVKQYSEDWWKLQEAIYSAEEAIAKTKNTIESLDQKEIAVLQTKQEDEDKPQQHTRTMIDAYVSKYQTEYQSGGRVSEKRAYDSFMKVTAASMVSTKSEIDQNKKQIAEWQALLATVEEGTKSYKDIQDKIWALQEENAKLENELLQDEIKLNEARLARIAQVLQHDIDKSEHSITLSDAYAKGYQIDRDYSSYRSEILSQKNSYSQQKSSYEKALEDARKEMDSAKFQSAAWYKARDAVFKYEEALAKLNLTQKELDQTLRESYLNEAFEKLEDTDTLNQQRLTAAQNRTQRAKLLGDDKGYIKGLEREEKALTAQAKSEKENLEMLMTLKNSGKIKQGTKEWDELLKKIRNVENQIGKTENDVLAKSNEVAAARLTKIMDDYKDNTRDTNHRLNMIKYQESSYKNNGELTNYGEALKADKKAQQEILSEQQKTRKRLKAELNRYDEGSEQYEKVLEQIQKIEEEIQKTKNGIDSTAKAIKENEEAIRKVKMNLENTLNNEMKKRVQEAKERLSAEVSLQNNILNTIKKRYKDEWELIKKDLEKKKKALNEEKSMIQERMNARKEAENTEDKYTQLGELQKQLAIIEADPTRSKEAKELRKQIADLQKELSGNLADNIAQAEQKRLDDIITGISEYESNREEDLNEFLSDNNNFKAILDNVLGGSEKNYVDYMKQYDENYKNATEEQRKQMEQGWHDTWLKMKGDVETYWKQVLQYTEITEENQADLRKQFIDYMKEGSEYQNASATRRKSLVYEWGKLFDNYASSIQLDADAGKPTITTAATSDDVKSIKDALSSNTFKVNVDDEIKEKLNTIAEKNFDIRPDSVLSKQMADIANALLGTKKYATGGLVNYTGLARVDGTPGKPEAFLSAADTQNIRMMLDQMNHVWSLPTMSSVPSGSFTTNNTVGDIHVTINEAQISNDYDVDELAKQVGRSFTKELAKNGFNTASYAF